MFSSEDEQDDLSMYDQLKCIRPFTIDQLYLLHPDVKCPPKGAIVSEGDQEDENGYKSSQLDVDIYQYLVEHGKLQNQLIELKQDIKKLYKKTHANIDKAWTLKEESRRKIAMCQQGKIAETTFKFKKAHIDKKHLDTFAQGFNRLIERISKDFIYYSFETQTKRNKIATHLSISYQTPDVVSRKAKLKSAIITLVEFVRYLGDTKSDFTIQCRKWIRTLARRFLEEATTDDYRFLISQLARGPVGTADWSADLIECKPYEQVSGFESVPQYITHCSTLLSELFYNLQLRIKQMKASSSLNSKEDEDCDTEQTSPRKNQNHDQNWSLVDPRFTCTEEVKISSDCNNLLSESDVIKFCLRIPAAQIFRAYVKKCLDPSDEFRLETDYEYVMLKLLTIGTIIIKTYQIGLETFNSIQYGSLIEYLSSQIRRTVLILSDQWTEFKHRLKGVDDALLMRLQVEYDGFMLRSILVILELRECGIWRHLSSIEQSATTRDTDGILHGWATDSLRPAFEKLLQVTGISANQQAGQLPADSDLVTELQPDAKDSLALDSSSTSLTYEFSVDWFKEVSEPMLWHILWQFYQNGFMNSCDYHSDNYWVEKFQEKSVVYLFVNKIRDSPPGECSYLINSITSMLLSRTKHDSKLVSFIASQLFNLTFKHKSLRDKVSKTGLRSLIRSAERFPNLISLYISLMAQTELDNQAIDLIRGCSLYGWLFDKEEFATLESWLLDQPLDSPCNKIARLIISKVLLNSPSSRPRQADYNPSSQDGELFQANNKRAKQKRRSLERNDCCVDLKWRRRIAHLLYRASIKHYPENNEFGSQSLGASVEVAFGCELYYDQSSEQRYDLLGSATDASYQQFYSWIWRLLFTLRMHILDQPETDWNDVQSRSGTSRSIKNTVIINDQFHPVPSIEDSECSQISDGLKERNPMASFIYLTLTDATWQVDTLDACLSQLNVLANSGHITPSLMAMEYLTICHLNDLIDKLAKDKKCIDYFTTIILSNFDATRLASLIATQLDRLKLYRQLQLSHFYIRVLLEVNRVVTKRVASSWFSSNEVSFEKIACLLDHLVRFNFTTQRVEIIRKFYECVHAVQESNQSDRANSWLGSLITSSSMEKDLTTNLHLLSQKFKKYTWLQWVTTESDALRLEKIWEDIVLYLSTNEEATLDSAIKKVCPNVNSSSLKTTLPIFSWIRQIFEIVEIDLNHPLCPLIWYNFFTNYFANSLNGVSVGFKLISQETVMSLMTRLDSLYNYHIYKQRNWSSTSVMQQNSLTSMYRAYKLWLQDPSLRAAYIDIDRLHHEYLVPLLKAVLESSQADICLQYIDVQVIEVQNKNLMQVWIASTRLGPSESSNSSMVCFENNDPNNQLQDESMKHEEDGMADDAVSLIVRGHNTSSTQDSVRMSMDTAQEELAKPLSDDLFGEQKFVPAEELMEVVKRNFRLIFEEANMFALNISELERTKIEILDLVQELYINKRREFLRVVPCVEGNECPGPARIKLEEEEALMDERKNQCIQDRRRQCQELLGELLLLPRNRLVKSIVIIEETTKRLIGDPDRSKSTIGELLKWLSKPGHYNHLDGSYHPANHLLKSTLDILATTDQADTFNHSLIDVCLEHPSSVQILSPQLSPSACSAPCFLELYEIVCRQQVVLGSMATFVLLSKFDLNSYLNTNSKSKSTLHQLIKTTCTALRNVEENQDDNYELAFELFKRHLQIELAPPARRQPEEFLLALRELLPSMCEHRLAPNLWPDFLAIIGFNVSVRKAKSAALADQLNESDQTATESSVTVESLAEDVKRLAETQLIFNYETSSAFMKAISDFMRQRHSSSSVTLLESYQDYIEQFGVVMLSATFIWLKTTSDTYPDNHGLIWKQFIDFWNDWVLLKSDCQRVSKLSYSLITNYFVLSLRYMIHKIPQNTCAMLQSMLFELTNYIVETREVIHLELTILQRCLKNLPWSNLIPTPIDIGNLAALSEQDNYNVSDLVSHIVSEMNTKESLVRIQQSEPSCVAHVAERLATIIVLQSAHLRGYKLYRRYFALIPVKDIPRLASLVLARTDFNNPELSYSNRLLMELFKYTCIDSANPTPTCNETNRSQSLDTAQPSAEASLVERFERANIYALFISNYLVDLIKRHPQIVNHNRKYLGTLISNSLTDLEPLLSSNVLDMNQKTTLYASLLNCCNCDALGTSSRLILAQIVSESHLLRDKPKLVVELVQAIGRFLEHSRVLVLTVERLVGLHLNIFGRYENVWSEFKLHSITEELYLNSCVEERAPLAMLVHFESLFSGASRPYAAATNESQPKELPTKGQIWCKLFQWFNKLTQSLCNVKSSDLLDGPKLTTAWVRVLVMFQEHLDQYLWGPRQSLNNVESVAGDAAKPASNTQERTSDEEGSPDQARQSPSKVDLKAVIALSSSRQSLQAKSVQLREDHECLLNLVKQLISLYDSINATGLWSYLKTTVKSDNERKVSVTALATATFLIDRLLMRLDSHLASAESEAPSRQSSSPPTHLTRLRDELAKLLRVCLSKLEAARKSKGLLECAQFIETLIESVQHHEKVQYNEGVQLIETYARTR